jgi:glutathione S-transferase
MTDAARFFAESFAPWCERARWALDHHRIAYREIEQVPLLAELSLRLAARRLRGRVTVPLLVQGHTALMNSDAIARHAEQAGSGAPLFPAEHEARLSRWMDVSESLMVAGRALLLPRLLDDAQALAEQLPRAVPGMARSGLRGIAAGGVHHLMRKYGVRKADAAHHEDLARGALAQLRAGIASARSHLVGARLTYADITLAAALQFVLPVGDRFIALGPATRRAWTHPVLAAEHPDLLGWRDRLYEQHRHRVDAMHASASHGVYSH